MPDFNRMSPADKLSRAADLFMQAGIDDLMAMGRAAVLFQEGAGEMMLTELEEQGFRLREIEGMIADGTAPDSAPEAQAHIKARLAELGSEAQLFLGVWAAVEFPAPPDERPPA